MPTRLIEIVEGLPRSKIVLVGDLMLDRYLYGNAERLSPEAPVPVLHYQKEELRLGGAGGVAANLAALGAEVDVIGVVGNDDNGVLIRQHLEACGCHADRLVQADGRPTTCKVRLVGLAQHRHPQQMMRLDFEEHRPLDAEVIERIMEQVGRALDGAAVLCIEDYNKGLLNGDLCPRLIVLARQKGVPVLVDPANLSDYSKYKGATALKLNRTETEKASGLPAREEAEFSVAAAWLVKNLGLEAAVVTLDKHGAYLATRGGEGVWLKTRQRQVYDVTGAGDMVLAMLAVARAAGASWRESVELANVAGGLEVERFGSVPVTPPEIIAELLGEAQLRIGKERTLSRLTAELAHHRSAGKKVVFTNGCFDLIHLGHVQYFRFAKAQGDLLVVGVNTDASIRRLKGEKRPIQSEADRLIVLEELASIDYLVRFGEDTPLDLITAIRPDVLVKGADYKKEQVVGWDTVEAYGGRVALAPLVDGKSTSAVIKKIVEAYGPAERV
ncbi:MAG TPA: D-glycero-beta-D-manno-heptose 1-phosphate adenylyltransferase [Tepidisphaeraceae bacterium]|jgi:D-beta-D-heptose 7-phosphate kinase/D-beta-D-heptose 1-phosphate adenosyltransferase|nr:D-glycero-beta-D-manno-heptose 1-phosphate adenylyltransferase [Tepidisphaeraceae bacterium]